MKYILLFLLIISCQKQKTEIPVKKNDSIVTYSFNKVLVGKAKIDIQNSFKKSVDDIVFIGDSKTEGFNLQETFNNLHIKNRGMGGDTTGDVLSRIHFVTSGKPKKIFLEIGVNDFGANSSVKKTFENLKRICEKVEKESPSTKVYVQSLLPTTLESKRLNEKINVYNRLLKSYCNVKGLTYIDLNPNFLSGNELNKKYTVDGIHLNAEGYKLWAILLKSYI